MTSPTTAAFLCPLPFADVLLLIVSLSFFSKRAQLAQFFQFLHFLTESRSPGVAPRCISPVPYSPDLCLEVWIPRICIDLEFLKVIKSIGRWDLSFDTFAACPRLAQKKLDSSLTTPWLLPIFGHRPRVNHQKED
jgi:hypothetical protein